MSRFDESLRAVHSLACLRHLDADPMQVSVVFRPLRPDCYPQGVKAPPSVPDCSPSREHGEACHWEAQVRLGPGKWGHNVGPGATPEEALEALRQGYVDAHGMVDERRSGLMGRLGGGAGDHETPGSTAAQDDVLGLLRRQAQERAGDETPLGVLKRLVAESKVDGPVYKAGRTEGHADVAANLRAILDPSDSKHLTLDGLLNSVQTLVDEKRERGGA